MAGMSGNQSEVKDDPEPFKEQTFKWKFWDRFFIYNSNSLNTLVGIA